MVFPSTWLAAFCLLILSVLCLSVWPYAYKAAGSRYRFEIFALDFAIGALLFALAAAYTLGMLGSELSFTDSMLVAGHRAEFMAFSAGAVFALGNMLLLCTISLVGVSRAILLSSQTASVAVAVLAIARGHYAVGSASLLLLLMGICLAILATPAQTAAAAMPAVRPSAVRPSTHKPLTRNAKGIITGLVSGLFLGSVLPVIGLAETESLGIGPYGGVLMACLGMFVATPFLNFYFMNLAIEGESLRLAAYLQGRPKQRAMGALGGALWAAGALALYVVVTAATAVGMNSVLRWATPFMAAIGTVVWGFFAWRGEFDWSTRSQKLLYGALALFVGGAILLIAAETQNFKV